MYIFRHSATAQHSVNITFICTEKPQKKCDSFYFNIHFTVIGWNWTHRVSKVCLHIHHNHFLKIFMTSKRNPIPFSYHSPIDQIPTLIPAPQTLRNHSSTFCFYGFVYLDISQEYNYIIRVFKKLFNYLFWLRWVFICYTQASFSCEEWDLLSSCGAWASHCGGFSCCRAWTLGHTGFSSSQDLEHRLSTSGAWV